MHQDIFEDKLITELLGTTGDIAWIQVDHLSIWRIMRRGLLSCIACLDANLGDAHLFAIVIGDGKNDALFRLQRNLGRDKTKHQGRAALCLFGIDRYAVFFVKLGFTGTRHHPNLGCRAPIRAEVMPLEVKIVVSMFPALFFGRWAGLGRRFLEVGISSLLLATAAISRRCPKAKSWCVHELIAFRFELIGRALRCIFFCFHRKFNCFPKFTKKMGF